MTAITMYEVIAWLEVLLPVQEPELWASLQPPAEANELERLRQAASPFDVTDEWLALLHWHNGGPWGGPWWPLLESGHLLGVSESVEHYQWLCANTEEWQWHRSWLPIAHDGWAQCGIELDGDYRGLIVDGSFPDPPRPKAPSLVALLHASCAVIEAGVQNEEPVRMPHAYVRMRQKELIDPIYSLYGVMPAELPPASSGLSRSKDRSPFDSLRPRHAKACSAWSYSIVRKSQPLQVARPGGYAKQR